MQDAHNLGWKLALVTSGRSPESLLDTYAEEREPIGGDVLALTHAIVQLGTVRTPWKRTLRDICVPIASRIGAVQRRAVRRTSQVHVNYRSSSCTQPGGSRGVPAPGERAPDVCVFSGAKSIHLYAALRSGRHVIVAPSTIRMDLDMCDMVHRDGPVWLVRPDGYIVGIARAITEYVRKLFGTVEANAPMALLPLARSLSV